MELVECVESRCSVRKFLPDPVPEEFIREVLRLANLAPSAGNLQARDFIVVRDEQTKERLKFAAHGQSMVAEAPLVIVCCANLDRIANYGPRGRELYCLQDVAASVEHILLYATDQGYGACWIGAFDEMSTAEILSLPKHVRPLAMIPIGLPVKTGHQPRRLPLEKLVHWDKW